MTARAARLALALVVCSPLLGGCSVNIGSSGRDNPVADRARDEGALRLDLTDGLTRAEVGMPDGRSSYSIGNTGGRPLLTVTLVLPEDVVVEREVADVTFKPADLTDAGAEPSIVELSQRRLDLAAARDVLDRSVDDLGLDPDAVATWAADAEAADPNAPYATTVLDGPDIGPVRVEVEVAQFAEDQQYGIRTILTLAR